jgi:ABC-2 type transport system permease protein
MSALGNIIIKEMKELMTPATFLPIIVMALIFGSMGSSMGGIEEQLEEPPIIGLIDLDNDRFSQIAVDVLEKTAEVVYNESDKEEALEILKEKDGVALIIIPKDFTEIILEGNSSKIQVYWIMRGAGILDSIPSSIVEELIGLVNTNITMEIIQSNNTINATTAIKPAFRNDTTFFKNQELHGLSPSQISNFLSAQTMFIPIVMMMIIIMAGQIVISSMALEKENKTLETLLTLPVKRTSIVAGKIIASAVIGLMLAVIYMIGMGFYLQGFQFGGGTSITEFNLVLSGTDFLLIGLTVFVSLIAALAFCMLLGTMAKNFKSAQTLTFPVAVLVLIPMFITMFKDFDTLPMAGKALLFGIPFSHPMMAPRALIFDDYMLVIAGIIYVLIFAIIMIVIVVWIFKTDKLLTGSTNPRWKKLFRK